MTIDLINFSSQSVKAELDAVTIEVFYEPLPTFCLTDVFSVCVDQRADGCKYMWRVPQGFEWTSKSTNNYIVDFKASHAAASILSALIYTDTTMNTLHLVVGTSGSEIVHLPPLAILYGMTLTIMAFRTAENPESRM